MTDVSSDISQALQESGIDPATMDDGSLDPSEFASLEQEAPVESEEVESEEMAPEAVDNSAEVETQGEEKTEAPIEEPKLTAKQFEEIYAARTELEGKQKAFDDSIAKREQEFQSQYSDKLEEYNKFDSFLASLATKDPDLFGLLQGEYQEHTKHYANPVVDKVSKEIAELKKELGQFKAKASDEVTLTKLSSAMNDLKAGLGKEAEALNIKVDYNVIEDMWAKGIEPKEAFYAKYGESLHKAALSKAKVDIATKKVESTPKVSTVGNIKRSTTPVTKDFKAMSWDEALSASVRSVLGKT